MLNGNKIVVVLPAYNAETTLAKTVREIDRTVVDEILIVDDASVDETVKVAIGLGLAPICHKTNRGYGGNQKTCYCEALLRDADVVVMLHPDYQYSVRLVAPIAAMIAYGEYDMVLGSRILAQNAVRRGMPLYKYVSNRVLTFFQNLVVRGKLSEYHTGLRAYSRELLLSLPLAENSDDFIFDNQLIMQALTAGARIGELSCPTRYANDSSSIKVIPSIRYGFGVIRATLQYRLQRMHIRRYPYLDVSRLQGEPAPAAPLIPLTAGRPVAPTLEDGSVVGIANG